MQSTWKRTAIDIVCCTRPSSRVETSSSSMMATQTAVPVVIRITVNVLFYSHRELFESKWANTFSLKKNNDEGLAIECAKLLAANGSKHSVRVLDGGYESFSRLYPFLRTQQILYMPRVRSPPKCNICLIYYCDHLYWLDDARSSKSWTPIRVKSCPACFTWESEARQCSHMFSKILRSKLPSAVAARPVLPTR